nr:leucine-rich repeat domain-containing protein [Acholeplasmatales bacterium]
NEIRLGAINRRKKIKRVIIGIIIALSVIGFVLIIYTMSLKNTGFKIEKNGNQYVVCEDTKFFGDGVVEYIPDAEDTDIQMPDTITRWSGIIPKVYKVKYVYASDIQSTGVSISLPRYFEGFKYEIPVNSSAYYSKSGDNVVFENISVSSKNKKYDSRDNCGCLIDSKTDTLIRMSENGFIPDGVKTIQFDGMYDYFKNNRELVINDSIEVVEDYAFGYSRIWNPNGSFYSIDYVDFGSVKKIGANVICCGYISKDTKIVLPKTLESISYYAFNSCSSNDEYASIFYEGSKDDWSSVVKYDYVANAIKYYDDIYLGYPGDSFVSYNFYYYSETEPTEKNVYWHYGEDSKPVIWS